MCGSLVVLDLCDLVPNLLNPCHDLPLTRSDNATLALLCPSGLPCCLRLWVAKGAGLCLNIRKTRAGNRLNSRSAGQQHFRDYDCCLTFLLGSVLGRPEREANLYAVERWPVERLPLSVLARQEGTRGLAWPQALRRVERHCSRRISIAAQAPFGREGRGQHRAGPCRAPPGVRSPSLSSGVIPSSSSC